MDHLFNLEMVLGSERMHLILNDLHLLEDKVKMEQFRKLFLEIMNGLDMQWQ
jgi:hypothetical protein